MSMGSSLSAMFAGTATLFVINDNNGCISRAPFHVKQAQLR